VYGADWSCKAPIKLVHAAYAKSKQQQHEEVVVLSKVLAADINLGYQDIGEALPLSQGRLPCVGLLCKPIVCGRQHSK
jgi:hypothetical protein